MFLSQLTSIDIACLLEFGSWQFVLGLLCRFVRGKTIMSTCGMDLCVSGQI